MNIIASGSPAVNEIESFYHSVDYYILPRQFPMFGVQVKPLGKRGETDSMTFRFYASYVPDDLWRFGFRHHRKNLNRSDLWLPEFGVLVSFYKIYKTQYFDIKLYSLTKFALGRSSAVFSIETGFDDRCAALRRLNDVISERVPIYGDTRWFDAFNCEIPRADQFVDLRFKNKSELDAFFNAARRLRFERFTGNGGEPVEYRRTAKTERSIYWLNGINLASSTEFLKLYAKRTLDENRKFGDEENKLKLRLEVSRQRKGLSDPLADAFKNDLGLSAEDLTLENLMRRKNINQLFWTFAEPFFESVELSAFC